MAFIFNSGSNEQNAHVKIRYRNWFWDTGKLDIHGLRIWQNFGRQNNIIIEGFFERKRAD